MAVTQKERPVEVIGPLGKDALLFRRMTGSEQLGRMFEFELDLFSEDDQIKHADVLGQNMAVRLNLPDDKVRYFNGFASRFAHVGSLGRYAWYQVTLRPWLWFLTRTADCRIFQEMTAPDIIKEIFREHGLTDFEEALSGSHRTWTYCVQYRETDFNFVSRLMEQEGIYYFFKHEEKKHTLVLADSYSSHEPFPGYEEIPFLSTDDEDATERDHFFDWAVTQEVQPGAYALNEFDFEKPKADLNTKSSVSRDHDKADLEVYDYPGEYVESGDGDNYARTRIEEFHSQYEQVHATSNARGLCSGYLFKVSDCPRDDQNREYLILSAQHEVEDNQYESGADTMPVTYHCSIVAMDAKQPYRAPRVTTKPIVQGPQTAIVVGKSGEEIWTDKYGRVKVQFHWDRYGKSDENSSCWVRVAQIWAGKTWGGIQVPRMGQEVIVEFLEGDPDRPIITGRVYNADCMPPYGLPDNATQSGIKSRSCKEGSTDNFNEIRFEDKKDEEQLFIHAEKNQDIEVENDETHWVGRDRTKTIDQDEKSEIKRDRTEEVGRNESITIDGNRTEHVKEDEKITIDGNRTEKVEKDEKIDVVGDRTRQVSGDEKVMIDGDRSKQVSKSETLTVTENRTHDVGKNEELNVGKKMTVIVADEIAFETGKASLVLKKNGEIQLKGKDIKLDGSGKIDVKAGGDLKLAGSKISGN